MKNLLFIHTFCDKFVIQNLKGSYNRHDLSVDFKQYIINNM
jgi:hypothetical protein